MYEDALPLLDKDRDVNKYFFDRGVSEEVFRDFELGTARQNHQYFTLSGSPCFTIRDINGELISVGCRKGTKQMKYYYLPFGKAKTLYGIHLAIPHILEKGFVFIVEGIFDALLMHSHGHKNTVAIMGSSISKTQLMILASLTNGIKYIPDVDGPGLAEFDKNRNMMYTLCKDLTIDVVYTYPHKDIADYLVNGGKISCETV